MEGIKRYIQTLTFVLILHPSVSKGADSLEDKVIFGTNATSRHLFHKNPALMKVDKTVISLMRAQTVRKYSAIGSPDDRMTKIEGHSAEKEDAVGILLPLGGASLGLTMQIEDKDKSFEHIDQSSPSKEQFRHRRYGMRFVVDLTDSARFAFGYRYATITDHIRGGYFIGEDDSTTLEGTLNGYVIGYYQEIGKGGIGFFHGPPLRGKAEAEGEQKIIAEPGTSGIEIIGQPSSDYNLGISLVRWFHKRDDRSEDSTSPNQQRRISLNGIDLEQHYLKTQVILVGMDYFLNRDWLIKGALYKQSGVFLSDPNKVPGDDKSREYPVDYMGVKLAASFSRGDFSFELGKVLAERKKDRFRDQQGLLGFGTYGNYKAKDDVTYISLGFTN